MLGCRPRKAGSSGRPAYLFLTRGNLFSEELNYGKKSNLLWPSTNYT